MLSRAVALARLEDLIKRDNDLALTRKLEQLRLDQKEVAEQIDNYNGVMK